MKERKFLVTLFAEQNGELMKPLEPQSEFVKHEMGELVQKLLGVPGL